MGYFILFPIGGLRFPFFSGRSPGYPAGNGPDEGKIAVFELLCRIAAGQANKKS